MVLVLSLREPQGRERNHNLVEWRARLQFPRWPLTGAWSLPVAVWDLRSCQESVLVDQFTNIVYIDQPAGTGFSPGPPSVKNEIDVANQFNDFWKRFMTTFAMEGYKVYITGESYAGQYIVSILLRRGLHRANFL